MLDGACFRGFPEGIVEPSRGVSDNSRHSFPIGKLIIIIIWSVYTILRKLLQEISLIN